jgi:mRNA interferase RelE/StbE
MAWRIDVADSARKQLRKLDPQIASRILTFLHERLQPLDNPRLLGEAPRGSDLGTLWKYRVGDWRIIASIEDEVATVLVVRIGNRREVYRR